MIGISSSSKSFAALGKYLVVGRDKVEEGRVAWTSARNLPTDDPELAAKIMRATASQNVRVSQPVYHLALSFDPGDVVDRAAMERVADRVLTELKLDQHQAVIVAHADRSHPHVHILVNRVHPETGLVWDRWQDYPVIQRVLREEEKNLGLRPVEASLETARERGTAVSVSTLSVEFDAHDRVNELAQQRYAVERDVAAGEARLTQLGSTLRREEQARASFEDRIARAYRDPNAARDAFLRSAEQGGEREAAQRMRDTPEAFGELRTVDARRGRFGRSEQTDLVARDVAREAAGYGVELVAARRELARLVGAERMPTVSPSKFELDGATVRMEFATQLDAARGRVQSLHAMEKTMPTREQIEYRLARGLRRLSPPEFEQLRKTLSPHRLTLAYQLRKMVRDAALGRDDE